MEQETRRRGTYSEHRAFGTDLVGLFTTTPFVPSPEDEILDAIRRGSKYKRHNIVAVGFGIINSEEVLELKELYLTATGFLESDHQRYAENYQRLKAMFPTDDRLILHLKNPKILALNPDKKDRPLPHYKELDGDRVLALYITREKT